MRFRKKKDFTWRFVCAAAELNSLDQTGRERRKKQVFVEDVSLSTWSVGCERR